MSKKSIRKLEKIFTNEDVKGIKKDSESGKWKLLTQSCTRERSHMFPGEVKSGKLTESDELYEICDSDVADVLFGYEDIEGVKKVISLKKA